MLAILNKASHIIKSHNNKTHHITAQPYSTIHYFILLFL